MPYIVKTSPSVDFVFGERITSTENTFKPHGGHDITPGDEVFIWFSEQQGGRGLAGIGEVNEVVRKDNRRREITLTPIDITPHTPMTNSHLEQYDPRKPHVDANDGRPIVAITKKLLVHSLNKVAYLTDEEADLLRGHFR